jgi:hypothetical protein
MARPRIGITAYRTNARWTHWDLAATVLPQGYVEGVRLAGGVPLMLPPTPDGAESPAEVLDGLDDRHGRPLQEQLPRQEGPVESAVRKSDHSDPKNFLMSWTSRSGSSIAAKCPPRSNSVQCTIDGIIFSASDRTGTLMSCGKTATPVGTADGCDRPHVAACSL